MNQTVELKLKNVFEVGKLYSICASHDNFGQLTTKARFEGVKLENNPKQAFYDFGKDVLLVEKAIKDFYVINNPSNKNLTKYISVDLKNGMTLTIVELAE